MIHNSHKRVTRNLLYPASRHSCRELKEKRAQFGYWRWTESVRTDWLFFTNEMLTRALVASRAGSE